MFHPAMILQARELSFKRRYHCVLDSKLRMRYAPTFYQVRSGKHLIFIGTSTQCKAYQVRRLVRLGYKYYQDTKLYTCNECYGLWITKTLSPYTAN